MNWIAKLIAASILIALICLLTIWLVSEYKFNNESMFEEGYKAALNGLPVESNPLLHESAYFPAWQRGWQKGYLEKTNK